MLLAEQVIKDGHERLPISNGDSYTGRKCQSYSSRQPQQLHRAPFALYPLHHQPTLATSRAAAVLEAVERAFRAVPPLTGIAMHVSTAGHIIATIADPVADL